jgi:hypothetical protein
MQMEMVNLAEITNVLSSLFHKKEQESAQNDGMVTSRSVPASELAVLGGKKSRSNLMLSISGRALVMSTSLQVEQEHPLGL